MFLIEKRETTSEIKMSLKAGLGKERIDVEKLSKISFIPFICLMSKEALKTAIELSLKTADLQEKKKNGHGLFFLF